MASDEMPGEAEHADARPFCPLCGMRPIVGGMDDDGCCTSCGADVCSLGDVKQHLLSAYLRVEPVSMIGRRHALARAWCEGGGDGLD